MTNNCGQGLQAPNASWSFGGKTPEAFHEHITNSVPFYSEGHDLVLKLSDFFVKKDSTIYEIGPSLGTLIAQLSQRHERKSVQCFGLEIESDMVKEAERLHGQVSGLEFLEADIITTDLASSDLIVAYYSLQFIPPRHRQDVINKIYQSLNWGGAFLFFEKVRAPDARFQDYMASLYQDFKLDHGHTPSEIVAKSRSLKGVLEPFSSQANLDLLKRAGFVDVMTVMKYVSFEGFLAVK